MPTKIAHLTYFDYTAAVAIADPDHFKELVTDLISNAGGGDESVDDFTLGEYRKLSSSELLKAMAFSKKKSRRCCWISRQRNSC